MMRSEDVAIRPQHAPPPDLYVDSSYAGSVPVHQTALPITRDRVSVKDV